MREARVKINSLTSTEVASWCLLETPSTFFEIINTDPIKFPNTVAHATKQDTPAFLKDSIFMWVMRVMVWVVYN